MGKLGMGDENHRFLVAEHAFVLLWSMVSPQTRLHQRQQYYTLHCRPPALISVLPLILTNSGPSDIRIWLLFMKNVQFIPFEINPIYKNKNTSHSFTPRNQHFFSAKLHPKAAPSLSLINFSFSAFGARAIRVLSRKFNSICC